MNKWKGFYEKHYGESVELKYRLFCICASLGTLTSLGGFILSSAIAGVTSPIGLSTLCGFLIMLFLSTYGIHSKKIEMVAIVISVLLNLLIFPISFLVSGALYSVAPIFFIMGIQIAVPLTSGMKRSILFFTEFVVYCGIIILCYLFPNLSYVREQSAHITMLLFSFVIVSFYLFTSTWMIVRHYDIERSKTKRLNEQLSQQAIRDPLTHLYNRRYLMDFLEHRFSDKQKEFGVAMLDIDDFKKINDTYGHTFGDDVIIKLAKIMETNIYGKGFVARYGGEEFIVYFDSNNMQDFINCLYKTKEEFKEYYQKEKNIKITFSAGIALYKEEQVITELFDKADTLLYEAKRDKKNKICYTNKA